MKVDGTKTVKVEKEIDLEPVTKVAKDDDNGQATRCAYAAARRRGEPDAPLPGRLRHSAAAIVRKCA